MNTRKTNTALCSVIAVSVLVPLNVFAQGDPPVGGNLTIEDYRLMVMAELPPFGSDMLNLPPGGDPVAEMMIEDVAGAVNDPTAPDIITQTGPRTEAHDAAGNLTIIVDDRRGRVRYVNLLRLFDHATSPMDVVSEEQAEIAALDALDAMGFPPFERTPPTHHIVMAEQADAAGHVDGVFECERLVDVGRVVNGYPVLGSRFRIAVNNVGEVSRVLAISPQFAMLQNIQLRGNEAVVNELAQRIFETADGLNVDLKITLAYVRRGPKYMPAAVAEFIDDTRETAGQEIAVRLAFLPPDEDFDGVPDAADNCADDRNPSQSDADGDGIGDACDNCPDDPNIDQLDDNNDGVGDACEVPDGACCGPEGCEIMRAELCSFDGATYLGDGTECVEGACSDCETVRPRVAHAAGLVGQTRPFSGFIDPAAESSDGSNLDLGIREVTIRFDEPIDPATITPSHFSVRETGGGTPPDVIAATSTADDTITLTLSRPITAKEWTTIEADVRDSCGNPIESHGSGAAGDLGPDQDEPDRVDIAFLPCDVSQDGEVGPFDLLILRQYANGVIAPEAGTVEDFTDIDRDGALGPFDVLRFRQLVRGLTPATQPWMNETLNHTRP